MVAAYLARCTHIAGVWCAHAGTFEVANMKVATNSPSTSNTSTTASQYSEDSRQLLDELLPTAGTVLLRGLGCKNGEDFSEW